MEIRFGGKSIVLKSCTQADIRYCYRLSLRSMAVYKPQHRTYKEYAAEFSPTNCRIVWYKGRRFGFVEFEKKKDGWHLWDLQISRVLQNKGLGSALLHYVESEVRKRRGKSIQLNVYKSNRAVHLYQRFGYVIKVYNPRAKRYKMEKTLR